MTRCLAVLDFEIRDRRLEMRIPIDHTLVAIDQVFFVELNKHFADGLDHLIIRRASLAHCELLARPIA